jgi:integrase
MSRKRDHGDGGIDQRGPDRWRLRWRVAGKRHTKAFHGTKKAAQAELRRLLKAADDGQHVAPDKVTLGIWIERWIALQERRDDDGARKGRRGLVNQRTLERYSELMRLHVIPLLGARPIQQIAPTEIDALYTRLEQKLAARTVHHVHRVLGTCLNAAVRKGMLVTNPISRAEPPSPGNEQAGQVLQQEQLATLLNGFRRTALYPIVATAAFTGARRNEILALRWSDLDMSSRTLTIRRALEETRAHGVRFKEPKTGRGIRSIAIDENLVALLSVEREKHLRLAAGVADGVPVDLSLVKLPEGALMFPSPPQPGRDFDFTRPRDSRSVTKEFIRRARDKLGFANLRFHDLRATHETLLLDAGVPVHVVAARCGHDPAILLRVYAKRTRKADASAAAVIGKLSTAVLGAR